MAYTTQQRTVLNRVIQDSERPLTPAEICEAAQKEVPDLGMATVYRALKQFMAEGQVKPVTVPGAAPHYESAQRHHHHFFLCEQCKRLFNLLGCVKGVHSLAPEGFRVHAHEIVLFGECPSCLAAAQ